MNEVYVTDLDGTLLDREGRLSIRSRELLEDLLSREVPFTVASARSIDSIRAVLKDLPLRLPVIEFNGAYLTDYASGTKLQVQSIDRSLNRRIHALLSSYEMPLLVTCHEADQDVLHFDYEALNEGGREYVDYRRNNGDTRLVDARGMQRIEDREIICFNAIDTRQRILEVHDALKRTFGADLEVHMMKGTYDDLYWLNVADPGGTKGHALRRLKERFLPSEAVLVVFGDNRNDLGMFEAADIPVALENSVEELKALAAATIGYHYEDSVARYVYGKAAENKHETD